MSCYSMRIFSGSTHHVILCVGSFESGQPALNKAVFTNVSQNYKGAKASYVYCLHEHQFYANKLQLVHEIGQILQYQSVADRLENL